MPLSKLTKEWVIERLPKRPKDAHKGTFGKVLVFAGSKNFPGAAYLCSAAAYRVGAGLVTLVTEPEVKVIVSRKLPELTFLTFKEALEKIKQFNVLLIGPGLEQGNKCERLLSVNNLPPVVLDAGGLDILFKIGDILTPHPGEMSKLTGLKIEEIQKNRESTAKLYAKKWNKIVVLKGANTVIAAPDGDFKISPFANPNLATAGTGDVLAGVIAGLTAQGLNPFDAACVGVYIHGMAGENISLASDLLPTLPQIIKKLT